MDESLRPQRDFMKSSFGTLGQVRTDQDAGVPPPSLQKPPEAGCDVLDLPAADRAILRQSDVHACIADRQSRRTFLPEMISREELAYLLWATQGVREIIAKGKATFRTVPSGGARHPFETYLVVQRVAGLDPGLYRYLPLSHQLVRLNREADLAERTAVAANQQTFVAEAAVVFIWSCIPYRAEWRYHLRSHKTMLLDAGHVCQNLYLACEALGLGTCAIAAYNQQAIDELLGLDGQDEYVVYLSPVGRPS